MSVHRVTLCIPPTLLPKKSWEVMMSDLENHFGDDASIDDESNKNILAYLVKNSAETSSMESSWNFLNSIGDKDIKNKANCKACHSDIEKGLIEDENIKNLSAFK